MKVIKNSAVNAVTPLRRVERVFRRRARVPKKLLVLFGTRPEVIKLAPIVKRLESYGEAIRTVNVTSAQHTDLLYPLIDLFKVRLDHNLRVMRPDQTANLTCSRVLDALDPILARENPDLVLVQGDTTTALAGALAGFHRRVAVAHVEAGLRSGDVNSPWPEEMNRKLITRLATYHFAATERNRDTLVGEGVGAANIFVTGNPVVDSLRVMLDRAATTPTVDELLRATADRKTIVLTTHRRESFGGLMAENLRAVREFVEANADVALVFPVHPNPSVVARASEILSGHPRIHLTRPLDYVEFLTLLKTAWLIVSDSGGVQEEAPSLGKPLLIIRENTERPEVIDAGVARLVGPDPRRLALMLDEAYRPGSWANKVSRVANPFGRGDSGEQIAAILARVMGVAAAN